MQWPFLGIIARTSVPSPYPYCSWVQDGITASDEGADEITVFFLI